MKLIPAVTCLLATWSAVIAVGGAADDKDKAKAYVVTMKTTEGVIELELNREKAPGTVDNFLAYAKDGYYEGTLILRVEKGYVVQGGGYHRDKEGRVTPKSTGDRKAIKSEAGNGLANSKGTIAAARGRGADSAKSEFFINLVDNPELNHPKPAGTGYTVFGKVTKGMDVLENLARAKVGEGTLFLPKRDGDKTVYDEVKVPFVPAKDIVIERVDAVPKG